MQKGLIDKILNYGFENYRNDIQRAMDDFFGESIYDLSERDVAYFNEWLIFDYRFSDGKSFLESYIEKNRYFLSKENEDCVNLFENTLSIFKTLSVSRGNSMTALDVCSGKEYFILERQGTEYLKKNDLILCRIAKVDDHYEIISSQIKMVGNADIDDGALKYFKNIKEKLTVQDMYDLDKFNEAGRAQMDKIENVSPKQSEKEMEYFLKKYGLGDFLNINLLREWILRAGEENFALKDVNDIISVVFTLAGSMPDFKEAFGNKDIAVLQNFFNTSPQGKIGGVSPLEKIKGDKGSFGSKGFMLSARSIGLFGIEKLMEGSRLLQAGKIVQAKKKFEKCFTEMLEAKTVISDPYRAFVNVAVCVLRGGDIIEAKRLIEQALDLNPNYTFGKKMMSRIQNGEFDYMYLKNAKKSKLHITKDSPASLYYAFLKELKINFKSKKKTVDKIFTTKENRKNRDRH